MRCVPILAVLLVLGACGDDRPLDVVKFGELQTRRTDDVYVAGQPSADDLGHARDAGIRTVISTRPDGEVDWDERARVEELGMAWVSIPFKGTAFGPQELAALESALASEPGPYLFHCSSGNRVSGLWALHLIRQGKSVEEALAIARSLGLTKEPVADRVREQAADVRR